jgi:hypothetical protein
MASFTTVAALRFGKVRLEFGLARPDVPRPVPRQQPPRLLRAANQPTDPARGLSIPQPPPPAAMPALQREKLPRQPKLLVKLRVTPPLLRVPLQRRVPRHEIHAAESPAQLPSELSDRRRLLHAFSMCATRRDFDAILTPAASPSDRSRRPHDMRAPSPAAGGPATSGSACFYANDDGKCPSVGDVRTIHSP